MIDTKWRACRPGPVAHDPNGRRTCRSHPCPSLSSCTWRLSQMPSAPDTELVLRCSVVTLCRSAGLRSTLPLLCRLARRQPGDARRIQPRRRDGGVAAVRCVAGPKKRSHQSDHSAGFRPKELRSNSPDLWDSNLANRCARRQAQYGSSQPIANTPPQFTHCNSCGCPGSAWRWQQPGQTA